MVVGSSRFNAYAMQKKYERMTVKKRHGIDYLFIPSGSKGRLRYIAPEYYKDLVMKNFEWVIEHWENEVKKIPDIVNMCVIKRHKGNFYVNLPPRWQSKLQYNFLLIPARILGEQRVKVVPTDEIY